MKLLRRNLHVFMSIFLAFPCLVSAQGESLVRPVPGGSIAGDVPLQLAAAIGIIRSEPSAPPQAEPQVEEPVEPPVGPVSPPVVSEPAASVESPLASDDEEVKESEPSGISSTKIWIGVGVAALLGAVAGGGSTSQH